jgi:mono/diheme cytochrome c family protein
MTVESKKRPEQAVILMALLWIHMFLVFVPSSGQVKGSNAPLGEFPNPYERPKQGPPLTNVIYKVDTRWLYNWLKAPEEHDPNAKMPNLKLDDNEIKAVGAYLAGIADQDFPQVEWEPFLLKTEDEMTDGEWERMDALFAEGKQIWSKARCTICHAAGGRGGFLKLGVAFDLSKVAFKVNRNWLYQWIKDPKEYFPETLMPRYRFSDGDLRALVEYILRDDAFSPEEDEESEEEGPVEFSLSKDESLVEEGKRVIELSRCVLCHDIEGIEDMLPVGRKRSQPSDEFAELLNDVRCLTCHSIQGTGGDYAPDLTYAGSKLKVEWTERFLAAPDMIRPLSQQMPRFNLTEAEAKIAARYIKENFVRPGPPIKDEASASPQIDQGRGIFRQKGCLSCHLLGEEGGSVGPDLTDIRERLEPEYIFYHLKHPQQANPYAVEPDYGLSDEEAMALTRFLLAPKEQGIK